ncbi:hypothetical protein P4U44_09180 [Alkalihalobacillus alcalophilus]|uniref:hypothetical protein n=1 Tax=Alkalihalobacillus alcalophilus TaxID=1445 RepID=UPI00136211CA|nr:hypothetical protein [Alkalihalobacillus alcalophilus]MED1562062.1 hypothetical protein [Alkalihalobacillus alcalophilus]
MVTYLIVVLYISHLPNTGIYIDVALSKRDLMPFLLRFTIWLTKSSNLVHLII